jgi:hypothetical protein
MRITMEHISELNKRILGGPYEGHFIDGINANWMLYGTDSAQKAYLVMMDTIREIVASLMDASFNGLPSPYQAYPASDHYETLGTGLNKTHYQEVSNYWIVFKQNSVSFNLSGDDNHPIVMSESIGKKEARDFFNRFNASDHSMDRLSPAKLTKGIDKAELGKTYDTNDNNISKNLKQYAVRRACKFLMYDAIGAGYDIRYALDDLNLNVIVQRLRIDGKMPVCTSELREIFRYWDFFSQHIKFYRDFLEVSPPWNSIAQQSGWSAYAAQRAQKLLDRGVNDQTLNACIFFNSINSHAAAVNCYHSANPSRFRNSEDVHMVNDATNGPDNM